MSKTILAVAAFLFAGTVGMLQAEGAGGGASNPGLSPPQGQQQSPASGLADGQDGDGVHLTDTHEGGKPLSKTNSIKSGLGKGASDDESIHLGSLGGNPKRGGKNLNKGGKNSASDDESIHLGSLGGNPKRGSKSLSKGGNNSASDDESIHLGSLGGNPKRGSNKLTHGKNTRQGLSGFTGGVKTGKTGKGLAKNSFQKADNLNGFSKNAIGGPGGASNLPAAGK